jgi:hypothetical protein
VPTSLALSGGILTGTDTITAGGPFTWSGGTVSGAGIFNANGGAEIGGLSIKTLDGRTLNNTGTANVTGGTLSIINGGIFNSTGPFNNQAIVDLQLGTLNLLGGGASGGIFSGNGTLQVGSNYTFQPGSSITNSSVIFSGGTVDVGGNYSLLGSNTTVSGGTVNFTGTVGAVGDLIISGGTANFSSGEAIVPTSLALSGGILTGTDTITAGGPFTWTGGSMSGKGTTLIPAGGTLNLSGPSPKLLDTRTLENGGTTIWSGGDIFLNNQATFKNLAGGIFSVQADQTMGSNSLLPGIFSNEGSFEKSAGSGTTTIATLFNNHGRVDVRTGVLRLSGGGAGGGIFSVAGGATLDFTGGIHNLAGGTVEALNGSLVQLSGGSIVGGTFTNSGSGVIRNAFNSTLSGVTITAGSSIENLDGQTLHLSGAIANSGTIANNSTGSNADIRAADGTVLAGGGVLAMTDNGSNRILGESGADRLVNGATHTIRGSGQIGADFMALTNQGLIEANQTAPLIIDTSVSGFSNEGTLRANSGSTLTVVDSVANTGAAVIEAAGVVNLNGGATGMGTYNVTGGSLTVGGNLGNASGGVFNFPGSVLGVVGGGSLTTTTGAPAIALSGSAVNTGSNFISFSGGATGTLGGAILSDAGSTFNVGHEFLSVSGGSNLTSTSRDAALTFNGSTVNTVSNFTEISGTGSRIALSGSLLNTNGSLNIVGTNPGLNGDVVDINGGGQLIMNSADPVLVFNGGTHTIGTADTTNNNTQNQIMRVQATSRSGTTGLGTFQAIKGDGISPAPFAGATNPVGTLVQATNGAAIEVRAGTGDTPPGAPVFGGNAVRLDTVLFEASLPIVELLGGGNGATTRLTTAGDGMDINRSRMVSLGPVVALDNGLISVTNGAFMTLRSGSNVDVTGDLLRLFNGSRIEVVNGPLIRVTGNSGGGTNPAVSTLNVSGALVNFGGSGGNTIIVNNNIPVTARRGGAANNQFPVNIGGGGASIAIGANPVRNPGLGSITVNGTGGAGTGVLIQATGGGKVNIAAP